MILIRLGVALGAGVLFGLGLAVSGMANPAKVLGFLDIFGPWDPSLAAVMATAIPVAALVYRAASHRPTSLTGSVHPTWPCRGVDRKLVIGAALFGVGWGTVGFCPGPAIEALVLDERAWIFVGAMALGMLAYEWRSRLVGAVNQFERFCRFLPSGRHPRRRGLCRRKSMSSG